MSISLMATLVVLYSAVMITLGLIIHIIGHEESIVSGVRGIRL